MVFLLAAADCKSLSIIGIISHNVVYLSRISLDRLERNAYGNAPNGSRMGSKGCGHRAIEGYKMGIEAFVYEKAHQEMKNEKGEAL
jgi:hypothetical protein